MKTKKKNEATPGQIFGKLTIIKYHHYNKNGKMYLCKCECGKEKVLNIYSLKNGYVKSCGCYNIEALRKRCKNLVGSIFGRLTAIERREKVGRIYYWLCRCSCGNEKVIAQNNLTSGKIVSCGCYKKEIHTKHGLSRKSGYTTFLKKDPIRKIKYRVSGAINKFLRNNNGKKGGRTFDYLPYTPQQLKEHLESQFEPWMTWENYGGKTNNKRKTWWIDHIIPQSHFQFISMEDLQFQECWALSNLRPLEKIENIEKGNRLN